MMDDSFSFEPVKLNAGSDPTKAGTKEEEEEGVLGKRHRNANGDAAQDVKAPTQHQQPSKKPKVEDPVAKAERRRILEEKKRLLADVEKELAKISQKSPSLPSTGGLLPGPKYSASAPTTPMLSSSTPLPAGRGAAASNRGRGAGRGARGGAAKSTPARATTPPEAIIELESEPAALSSLTHATGTATPLSSSSDHLATGGARGKRKSPSSSSSGIPRRASHDVSTLPTSPTPEGPVTRAKRARRPKRLDTFGGPASLSWALKQCQVLLKTLMTHKFGWPFNQPVDPIALNIPDYFDVIKHPMDLGTIKEQLDSGSYETEEEFAEDVRLVFTNTFTYNQPGSDIVVMASTLSSLFNEKFEILKAKIEERGRDAPEGVEETLKELRDSMSSVQRELERIKKTPNGRAGRAGAAEDQRPMTFEEKKKLSHAINNLPSDNLGMVVKIIHERMPQLTSSGEEIEIDIDALNPATLRHLERYVRSVTQRGRRRGSRTPSLTSSTSSSNNVQNEPLAPQGTQQKIEDVERQIKALTEHQQALTQKGLARSSGETDLLLAAAEEKKKKRNNDDSDSSESETDGSDSSDSETSDSESDSGSDSESTDSEAERKDAAAAAPAATPTGVARTDAPVVTTLPSEASAAGESSSEPADATTAVVAGEVAAASAPSPATASAGEDEGTHSENGLGANKAGSAISFSFDPSLGTKESSILPAEVGNGDESLPQAAVAIDDAPPKSEAPKQVALKNVDAWSELSDDFEAPTGKPQSPPSLDKTWSQFQTKKMQDAIREKERLEKEERERKERERREEERKQEEERRRREHEEAEVRRRREAEEAELNAQRERERQRQAERMARERGELSMMEQSLLMASFEQQAAPVLPLFQYKSLDDVEADFGDLDAQPTMNGEEDRAASSYGSDNGRGSLEGGSRGDGEVDNGEATETEEGAEMELSPTAPLPVPASDEMEEGQI